MKPLTILAVITLTIANLYSQSESNLKFIFIPHPRSDDQVNQSVYPAIAKIDFTKFDVTMLGGDITYSTSKDSTTLAYCDNLFNLGSPNTLWSFGNHDVQSGHRSLIKEFTGRESFYKYHRNGITFLVLDTELNANSFSSTFVKGEQLQMVKTVCDTIKESKYLILLHHRLMWMINNNSLESRLTDSIAASSRSMDTTNFYSDIYPLLQNVKNKGIQVLVFGGDRSKINIAYSPEDSITFYAARLATDLDDNVNNVIILDYNTHNKELKCNFISLNKMITSAEVEFSKIPEELILFQNYPNPFNPETAISYQLSDYSYVSLKVYDILGKEIATVVDEYEKPGRYKIIFNGHRINGNNKLSSGVYFYRLQTDTFTETRKMIYLR